MTNEGSDILLEDKYPTFTRILFDSKNVTCLYASLLQYSYADIFYSSPSWWLVIPIPLQVPLCR